MGFEVGRYYKRRDGVHAECVGHEPEYSHVGEWIFMHPLLGVCRHFPDGRANWQSDAKYDITGLWEDS